MLIQDFEVVIIPSLIKSHNKDLESQEFRHEDNFSLSPKLNIV